MSSENKPDTSANMPSGDAGRFLRLLDPTSDQFTFQTFDDRKGHGDAALVGILHGSLEQHLPELTRRNTLGAGIFVTVNKTDGKGRKAKNITQVRAVWHDDDLGTPIAFHCRPSITVESSRGKRHRYWIVDGLTPDEHRGVMENLDVVYGSDPNAKDLSRVLRVPGFFHMKGEPFLVSLIDASETRYSREDILRSFPPFPASAPSKPKSRIADDAINSSATDDPIRDSFALAALRDEAALLGSEPPGGGTHGGRNHALNVAATKLGGFVPSRLSRVEVETALFDACVANGLVSDGEGGVWATIASGLNYGMKTPRIDGLSSSALDDFSDIEICDFGIQSRTPLLEFAADISLNDIINRQSQALVRGLLHPGETAMLYGPSGAGKSFLALDLGWHVALGREWHGNRVRQAPVLYVCLEGVDGFRKRMLAYQKSIGDPAKEFARLALHVSLVKADAGKKGAERVIAAVQALSEAARSAVGLVIIDTLARAMAGDDENATADMMHFVEQRAGLIARSTGAAVIIVHHTNAGGTARGSGSLTAGCETVLRADRDGDKRTLSAEKVKDGTERALFHYTLEDVHLEFEEDGSAISSCVVRTTPVDPSRATKRKEDRDSKPLRVFKDSFNAIEASIPGELGAAPKVSLIAIKAEFESRYSSGESDPNTARETKARSWRKALSCIDSFFETRDEMVWRRISQACERVDDPFGLGEA